MDSTPRSLYDSSKTCATSQVVTSQHSKIIDQANRIIAKAKRNSQVNYGMPSKFTSPNYMPSNYISFKQSKQFRHFKQIELHWKTHALVTTSLKFTLSQQYCSRSCSRNTQINTQCQEKRHAKFSNKSNMPSKTYTQAFQPF
jgi:hypothetical protein